MSPSGPLLFARCPAAGGGLSYDPSGRLLPLDNSTNSGHHVYDYTYDKVGNRTTMGVTDNSGSRQHVYSYDSIYQITEVSYPAGYEDTFTDTEFGYDAAGNRTTVIDAGGTSSYVTNALNQYTSVGGAAYAYDGNGKGLPNAMDRVWEPNMTPLTAQRQMFTHDENGPPASGTAAQVLRQPRSRQCHSGQSLLAGLS